MTMRLMWIALFVMAAGCSLAQEPGKITGGPPHSPQVCFDGQCFDVEIADTTESREKGLMFRKELAKDRGMLFIFDAPGEYAFWMKNTLIPLDMIWLDENKKIVHIEKNVPPCQKDPCPDYPPGGIASYVLELPAGTVQRLGLAGLKVRFRE